MFDKTKPATNGQLVAGNSQQSNAVKLGLDDNTGEGKSQTQYYSIDNVKLITPAQVANDDAKEAAKAALLSEGPHDEGNAQCVKHLFPNQFAQNSAYGWLYNTGSHWVTDGAEAMLDRAIVETLTARARAALDSGRANDYKDLIAKSVPSASRVAGAKSLYSSLVYTPLIDFDDPPDLLNCSNGIVDLRTGQLRPHAPTDRCLYCVPTAYDPDADQSPWVKWLTDAVGAEMADWLQMAAGYSLTGHTQEETLFYLYGPPRAGKGMFTETLGATLGQPLAKEVTFATFTAARSGDSQNFDLAPLKPARMVLASESNQYERFNEAKVKMLTGGNDVYCAFKHRTHFSYRPQFKIWLSSNHPVNADPDDDAVWGRVRVVEFTKSHLGKENKALKRRMRGKKVLAGVLAWAVAGAVRWYQLGDKGLPELESSAQAKAAHRAEVDHVSAWIDAMCDISDPKVQGPGSMLYLAYESWCGRSGVTPKKRIAFTKALLRKGYTQSDHAVTIGKGQRDRVIIGLQLARLEP